MPSKGSQRLCPAAFTVCMVKRSRIEIGIHRECLIFLFFITTIHKIRGYAYRAHAAIEEGTSLRCALNALSLKGGLSTGVNKLPFPGTWGGWVEKLLKICP